ncbi:MAG TPA: hypothetical protein VN799_06125 [Acidimicrobiales bacterium]|nr:hypothetical protein [Acidimicrobiales bacterium]
MAGAALALVVVLVPLIGGRLAAGSPTTAGVPPNPVSNVDCNGWSTISKPLKLDMRALCTDPIQIKNGKASRFVDNGWYVGHDEPSVKFISTAPGSGNTMSYDLQLPVDPAKAPTASGSVTDYAELSPAPWFGLPLCDPRSYPQHACKPDSDSNQSQINNPNAAGSAFMELQFYPPGYEPFQDADSCSQTQWCVAMTIDSLSCTFNYASCNAGCPEPVNFAYLQVGGVPAGPPSPQLADVTTEMGNAQTLKLNPDDVLQASISDPAAGFTATVRDLTTGQTGFVTASAQNGFMDTDAATCDGFPFTFHAEFATAGQQNQVPWAALEGGVLMEQETGHFEVCNSVANQLGFSYQAKDGQSMEDPSLYQNCVGGGSEGAKSTGEGPCNPKTGNCKNAETEGTSGPQPCPTRAAASAQLCEFADAPCFPKGPRTITVNGTSQTVTWPVAGCLTGAFQNGDLDFDGTPYQPNSWPNGSANHPTSLRYIGPFDAAGNPYPEVQFETDAPGSEFICNTITGNNCDAPPRGAKFYPFWTMNNSQTLSGITTPTGTCVWNFGNVIRGVTTQTFGKDAQYGKPDVSRYGGTTIGPVMPNPEFSGSCPTFTSG